PHVFSTPWPTTISSSKNSPRSILVFKPLPQPSLRSAFGQRSSLAPANLPSSSAQLFSSVGFSMDSSQPPSSPFAPRARAQPSPTASQATPGPLSSSSLRPLPSLATPSLPPSKTRRNSYTSKSP